MKKPRLVCIGDLMLDVVVRSSADVEQGTDTPGLVRFRLGGSAGNTCRAFVALGGRAAFVGAAGSDELARRLVAAHKVDGVEVHTVRVRGATARLVALIAPDGERTFVTDRGVADALGPAALKASWFARADALHLPAYSLLSAPLSEACLRAVALVRARGGLISVDLASRAPLLAAGADNGLRAVRAAAPDVLFANVDEVAALVGRRGATRLLDIAPLVVVKLGAGGCRVLWRSAAGASRPVMQLEIATKPLAGVDTTGAGDAFDAGFLYQLLVNDLNFASVSPAVVRRAALAGHRSAARLLTSPRPELAL